VSVPSCAQYHTPSGRSLGGTGVEIKGNPFRSGGIVKHPRRTGVVRLLWVGSSLLPAT